MTLPGPRNQKPTVANTVFIAVLVFVILAMSLAMNVLWVRWVARL